MSDNAMAMVSNKSSASLTLLKSVHLIDFSLRLVQYMSVYNLCYKVSRIWWPLYFLNKHASLEQNKTQIGL